MQTLWQDLRFGLRMLAKNPGFTVIAVVTLALGIGANTAIFSFVNSLFLRPLPVADPDRVVRLYAEDSEGRKFDVFSYPNYADLRDHTEAFQELAAHSHATTSLSVGTGAEIVEGEIVSGNYFNLLGVRAAMGRTILPEDDMTLSAHPVVVVSHGFWQRRLGAQAGAVGQQLYINGNPFTVVGVMPESFKGTYQAFAADFWASMMMHTQVRPGGNRLDKRGSGWLHGTGRLKPGATIAQAQAELDHIAGVLQQNYPKVNQGVTFRLYRASALPEEFRQGASGMLGFFMAVVGLVLLAACANIAGILMARMTARHQEIAVRQSLGATRTRLVRQWLTESLLLSLLGSIGGLLFAVWAADGLAMLVPPDFTNFSPALNLDTRVLAFTLMVSMLAGVLCGLFPALRASRTDIVAALKKGTVAGGRHSARLQQASIVVQIAVSLVLLVAAGLLLRSLQNSAAFDPGFKTENLLLGDIELGRLGYNEERGRAFYERLTERLKALPGVEAVTSAMVVPLGTSRESRSFRIPGHTPPAGRSTFSIANNIVGPDYFRAMGIPLLRGRDFDARDARPGAKPVAVINETLARQFWPAGDAVGQNIQDGTNGPMVEIIGIARDIKYYTLAEEPRPYLYASAAQIYEGSMMVHIRTAGNPSSLTLVVRKEIESLDPNLALSGLTTLEELRQTPLFANRAMAIVSSLFGLLTLALSAVGIYGVISYSVRQRTHELGVRMALGAEASDVLKLILAQGLKLALIGIVIGLAAAFAMTRWMETLLFEVRPTDPLTFTVIAAVLTLVTLAACYIPARRATRVDPIIALRYE